ncbi:hypothetical protein JFL43_13355 [Viridibacillus sp. YIM B01967]|uniref:DUF4367 domain-containing protein n=1 Tax=Viridibacillus soli TaxID=2798301 RepID=A0ABS1H8T8_9BACL|nr:hypothetical protein [Viridibacillus soli]MBK3495826.1 hypothetical protein [Viridibacillus soli]
MKRLFVPLSIFLFLLVISNDVRASNDQFEQGYYDIGYKEMNTALQESTEHFKRDIALPSQLPPVPFTHALGRFNDLEGNENDGFEIEYINKDSGNNHYTIRIKPVEHRLELRKEHIDRLLKLKDGQDAVFSSWLSGANLLVFEKGGWQYILSVDKQISNVVTEDVLVDIANSIK